ncbi:MAG: transposase [Rhodobacteraceae bacterium]|nr:transposase [Paracoccaceae bacterium]
MSGDRHDMSEAEWAILHSVLPHKHQGPERVHDRRVMNGIFFVLRTGTPWRDLPERYGPTRPATTATTGGARTASGRRSWRNFKGLRAMTAGATTARPVRSACAWWIPRRYALLGPGIFRLETAGLSHVPC